MNPETAAYVLGLPLAVRTALSEVDRDKPGWLVAPMHWGPSAEAARSFADCPNTHILTRDGIGAWVSCDPTAILAHAAGLRGEWWFWTVRLLRPGTLRGVVYEMAPSKLATVGPIVTCDEPSPLRAAIAVLEKVIA